VARRDQSVGPIGEILPFMRRRFQVHWYVESPVMVEGAHAA
jgi:hypothetical protein